MQEVRLLVEETECSLSFTPLVLGLNHVLPKRDWWNYCCILCEAYVQGLWDLSLWGSLCSHSLLFTEIQVLTTLHLLCFFFFSVFNTGPGVPVVSVHSTSNSGSEYSLWTRYISFLSLIDLGTVEEEGEDGCK